MFFGLDFTSTEYKAQDIDEAIIQISPLLKFNVNRFDILPCKAKNTTPSIENNIPIICILEIFIFKINMENMIISIGIDEFIKRAFVAVVSFKPIYKKVLKQAIPKKLTVSIYKK